MVLSSAFHFWKLLKGVKLNSEFRAVLATITFAKKKIPILSLRVKGLPFNSLCSPGISPPLALSLASQMLGSQTGTAMPDTYALFFTEFKIWLYFSVSYAFLFFYLTLIISSHTYTHTHTILKLNRYNCKLASSFLNGLMFYVHSSPTNTPRQRTLLLSLILLVKESVSSSVIHAEGWTPDSLPAVISPRKVFISIVIS